MLKHISDNVWNEKSEAAVAESGLVVSPSTEAARVMEPPCNPPIPLTSFTAHSDTITT